MTEGYVRPPIVALEPPDPRLVAWRFRIVLLLLLAGVAVGVFFIARALTSDQGNAQAAPRHTAIVRKLPAA